MARVSSVTARSSDEEIIEAINAAGEHRYSWRPHDWPAPKSKNGKSWVVPNDIGRCSRVDTSLLDRLQNMVIAGILEEAIFQNEPRFRVINRK